MPIEENDNDNDDDRTRLMRLENLRGLLTKKEAGGSNDDEDTDRYRDTADDFVGIFNRLVANKTASRKASKRTTTTR